MEEEYAGYPVCITPAEYATLSFSNDDYPHQQKDIDTQKEDASYKAKSLSDGTKDKVGLLLGHKVIARLCPF